MSYVMILLHCSELQQNICILLRTNYCVCEKVMVSKSRLRLSSTLHMIDEFSFCKAFSISHYHS
jgi:hypothetical protein